MIVSHINQFILLSPWKTASSTCHLSLDSFNESPYSRFFYFNRFLNRVIHQHLTLCDLLSLPEGKLGYKLATFVRNPYDRAYSGFLQIQRDFETQPKLETEDEWISHLIRAQITENMSRVISAGFDFDNWIRLLPDYEVFEPGRNTNMVLHPCHYWTHVNQTQSVDFIGKVERFSDDFSSLCEYIQIEEPTIRLANMTNVGASPVGEGFKYVDRMSRKSLDRINELFAKDFELFDYAML